MRSSLGMVHSQKIEIETNSQSEWPHQSGKTWLMRQVMGNVSKRYAVQFTVFNFSPGNLLFRFQFLVSRFQFLVYSNQRSSSL